MFSSFFFFFLRALIILPSTPLSQVQAGYRLLRSADCPQDLYDMMLCMWDPIPKVIGLCITKCVHCSTHILHATHALFKITHVRCRFYFVGYTIFKQGKRAKKITILSIIKYKNRDRIVKECKLGIIIIIIIIYIYIYAQELLHLLLQDSTKL